jgi:6-phosphogluconate dehydrogenase
VRILGNPSRGDPSTDPTAIDDVSAALYASKVCSYAQGMALLRAGDAQHDFGLNLSEIARIWKGGCIIRAELLDTIRNAYVHDPELSSLVLDAGFSHALTSREAAWRRTVRRATELGIPVPAMAASLGYYDGLRRERSPASLIQAQRDYFGAHTYQRIDEEGAFHTDWADSKRTTRLS